METGVSALKGIKPRGIGREVYPKLIDALGRVGGPAALDVLGTYFLTGQYSDTWQPAAAALKSLMEEDKRKPTRSLKEAPEVKNIIRRLTTYLPGLVKQRDFDFERFRAGLDLLPQLASLYDNVDVKDEVAKALKHCIDYGDQAKEFDVCNRSFRALMEIGGSLADSFLTSIGPRSDWINHYPQKLPGELFANHFGNDDNKLKGTLDALFLSGLSQEFPKSHLQLLAASNTPEILYKFTPKKIASFVGNLFREPENFRFALSKLARLSFGSLLVVKANWLDISRSLLTAGAIKPEAVAPSPFGEKLNAALEAAKGMEPVAHPNLFAELRQEGWVLGETLGRTLIFHKDERCRAVKVQKKDEAVAELTRQKAMVDFMSKHRHDIGLRSAVPTAIEVCRTDDLESFLKTLDQKKADQFRGRIETGGGNEATSVNAYVYECDSKDYFTYLHQASDPKSFGLAASACLHDSIAVFKECGHLFTRLADIFHSPPSGRDDRVDAGRYRALIYKGINCGRIDDWQKAVEFVNMRLSGLADEGDCNCLGDLIDPQGELAQEHFSDMFDDFKEAAPALLMATHIAENLLVVELAAGKCALSLTKDKSDAAKDEVWKKMGDELRNLYGQVLSECACVTPKRALRFLDKVIDWKAYTRQMQFWMTDEYIAELHDKKMIPPDIYGPDVKTLVEPELVSDTFKQHGFKRNLEGGPDLGAFSGTNPLVEAVKARAITATFGLILAQTNSLATS